MNYVVLIYEQDYYRTYLTGLDYQDYQRLDLLPNGITLAIL